MERAITDEDKIKRAEEIYYRRNNLNARKTTTVNLNPKKEYKLFRKLIIQISICILIYLIISTINTRSDSLSVNSVSYIKNTMSYDVDIEKMFNMVKTYLRTINEKGIMKENIIQEDTLAVSEDEITRQEEKSINENEKELANTDNLNTTQDASSISQMEQDANYIKENFSLIKPIEGEITSRFGIRHPTTSTVPIYHTGIDIGVGEGTVFVSAMDGIVEQVSSEGDYRESFKNYKWRCNDFICSLQNSLCKRRG